MRNGPVIFAVVLIIYFCTVLLFDTRMPDLTLGLRDLLMGDSTSNAATYQEANEAWAAAGSDSSKHSPADELSLEDLFSRRTQASESADNHIDSVRSSRL